jgi:hypothetical protein
VRDMIDVQDRAGLGRDDRAEAAISLDQ